MVNQGYADAGASHMRRSLKGFIATSGGADRDINDANYTIRQRARMLYMSSPVATSAIRTNRTNVVGTGLVPKSAIDAEFLGIEKEDAIAWQQQAEREFALWAGDKRACDATGINDFYGLQQLALISWLLSGDVFALVTSARRTKLNPYALRLHLIEADRVGSPGTMVPGALTLTTTKGKNGNYIHDGVEVDANGCVVAYHIRNSYPQEVPLEADKYVRVEAYGPRTGLPNILHVMDTERPEQYRGVSYLAQIIEPMLQLRRYTDSELLAATVQSYFTAFIKTDTDPMSMPFSEVDEDGSPSVSDDEDEYEMGPGMFNKLQPGESIEFANPSRPYTGFEAFEHAMCEQMGSALEIPADLLLKSFNSSYSASRAALMEAWKAFRMRRSWFVDDFCRPVWELWMTEAVALGRIKAPGFFNDPLVRRAYLACDWIGPSQGQLDPTKEISAEILAIEQGLTTRHAAAIRLNGSDWDGNVEQLGYENRRLDEIGMPGDAATEPVDEQPTDDERTEEPPPDGDGADENANEGEDNAEK